MNAVAYMSRRLPPAAVRRLAALRANRFEAASMWPMLACERERAIGTDHDARHRRFDVDIEDARERVVDRWGGDLCGFLNALIKGELAALAVQLNVDDRGRSLELRHRLWEAGARLESCEEDVRALQPRPIVLGGHLVVQAPPRGMYPSSARGPAGEPTWPRPLPDEVSAEPPAEEPESLDELLEAADRALGVRLGKRGRDKGAWGVRAASLLGLVETGHDEPDWRGDVEVKTVPVARDASGAWRIAEDPAIAMSNASGVALAKLQRTLWLVRADLPDGDATILSWYLLESDAEVARLVRRYLHERPKGPRGTDQRGLYLHKRFFADAGLLATLNGLP